MNIWKSWIALACALTVVNAAQAEDLPSALIYISPHEFSHEVRVGVPPYYSRWVLNGPALEAAAREALAPHFSGLALCDGVSGADVLLWVKPQLTYNAGVKRYYAKVKAQLHLGNGKQVAVYKAMGERDGEIGSVYADRSVQQAYGSAMQDIVRQYLADAATQQAIAQARAENVTKAPCALIGAVPNP